MSPKAFILCAIAIYLQFYVGDVQSDPLLILVDNVQAETFMIELNKIFGFFRMVENEPLSNPEIPHDGGYVFHREALNKLKRLIPIGKGLIDSADQTEEVKADLTASMDRVLKTINEIKMAKTQSTEQSASTTDDSVDFYPQLNSVYDQLVQDVRKSKETIQVEAQHVHNIMYYLSHLYSSMNTEHPNLPVKVPKLPATGVTIHRAIAVQMMHMLQDFIHFESSEGRGFGPINHANDALGVFKLLGLEHEEYQPKTTPKTPQHTVHSIVILILDVSILFEKVEIPASIISSTRTALLLIKGLVGQQSQEIEQFEIRAGQKIEIPRHFLTDARKALRQTSGQTSLNHFLKNQLSTALLIADSIEKAGEHVEIFGPAHSCKDLKGCYLALKGNYERITDFASGKF